MKKQFYLLATIFVLSTAFMASPAKADTGSNSNSNSDNWLQDILNDLFGGSGSTTNSGSTSGSGTTGTGTSGTALPINNGIVFLTIAGIAIGVVTVKNKNKLVNA